MAGQAYTETCFCAPLYSAPEVLSSGSLGREAPEASAALRRKRPRRKQLRDHPFAVGLLFSFAFFTAASGARQGARTHMSHHELEFRSFRVCRGLEGQPSDQI